MAAGGQARADGAEDGGAEPDRPPLLDRDHLDRLAAHVGAGALADLLAGGRDELAERLDILDRAGPGGIAAEAHRIAGLAGTLGLARLARHAAEASRADQPAGPHLDALRRWRAASLAALDGWCADATGTAGQACVRAAER